MNNYQFLFFEREQGNFNEYLHRGLIGSNLLLWLDVYEFHLSHPKASTWSVANKFHMAINAMVWYMKKNFLTRPSEPVSTTYVPLTGGSMCTY